MCFFALICLLRHFYQIKYLALLMQKTLGSLLLNHLHTSFHFPESLACATSFYVACAKPVIYSAFSFRHTTGERLWFPYVTAKISPHLNSGVVSDSVFLAELNVSVVGLNGACVNECYCWRWWTAQQQRLILMQLAF